MIRRWTIATVFEIARASNGEAWYSPIAMPLAGLGKPLAWNSTRDYSTHESNGGADVRWSASRVGRVRAPVGRA